MSDYIRKQDAFDAVEARITELMTHPEFRRKHLDIDLSAIIRNISAIKPADVALVVHGRWIKEYRAKGQVANMCTECGGETGRASKFCPNCGAKMDGKE